MNEQFFGLSDTGKQRENNEDLFIAQQIHGNKFILASVIDGVGGYAGGEIAAEQAKVAIIDRAEKPFNEAIPMLAECFHLANERVIAERKRSDKYQKMSCVATVALTDISANQFYYAHVGDTRLYLFRDGSLVKISHDQSFVGFLEESGRLSEQAAMEHPRRNEINKALGFEGNINQYTDYIETGQSPFLPGDLLLLCSDGLSDMLSSTEMISILGRSGSLKEKTRLLIDMANEKGGRDNVTVVLVQNDKTPQRYAANKVTESVAKPQSVVEQLEQSAISPPVHRKKNNVAATIFAILALIFLATSVYLYRLPPVVKTIMPAKKIPGKEEIKLQQVINDAKGKSVILTDTSFAGPVIINQPIIIDKDSLVLKAKGNIVLQCDTGYNGPAIILSSKCRHIVLDSLSFNGFVTGVDVTGNALSLKNLRFNNCKSAIRQSFTLVDKKYFSGQLPVLSLKTDSLPVKTK